MWKLNKNKIYEMEQFDRLHFKLKLGTNRQPITSSKMK